MQGISSKAAAGLENKKTYNGNELQNKEFADGAGLEWYDFNARNFDQQTGRFLQVDPLIERGNQEAMAPYQFGFDNPIRYNDPDGKCPMCIPFIIEGIQALFAATVATTVVVANKEKIDAAAHKMGDYLSDRVNSKKAEQTGSYTNTHESGKTYDGKGPESRAQQSAKEKAKEYNDPVKSTDWSPAKNAKEAFKDEARRLREHGGPESSGNYNKINSPGEKMLKQEEAAKAGTFTKMVQSVAVPIVVATVKLFAWITQ